MIESITGKIASLNPAAVVIETSGGVGFQLNISLNTFSALEGCDSARLLVHEAIREDAWTLYGFINEDERELFRALVGVSGVGAASARMILSTFRPAELRSVISTSDSRRLKSVKGIGAKTAERIIVDLHDKIKVGDVTLLEHVHATSAAFNEALEAMVILGFPRVASQKTLQKLFDQDPTLGVEDALKQAMKML